MKVEQVMSQAVKTCQPHDSLTFAAYLMWEHDCGCVPVVDDNQHVLGMLTDRDICMAAYTQDRRLCEITVSSVMSKDVHGCTLGDSLETAEQIMQRNQIRRIPVLNSDEQLVGILSLNDLALITQRPKRERVGGPSTGEIEATLAAVCKPRKNGEIRTS